MATMQTDTRSIVGIRKRPSTPGLARFSSFASPRGPAEVPPRQYQTRVSLGAMQVPAFDAAGGSAPGPIGPDYNPYWGTEHNEIADGVGAVTPQPVVAPVLSPAGSPSTQPVATPQPAQNWQPAQPPYPRQWYIPSGASQGPAGNPAPVSSQPATNLVATSPSLTTAAATPAAPATTTQGLTAAEIAAGAVALNASGQPLNSAGQVITMPASVVTSTGTLTATQIAAGAVGLNAAGQPVDVNGNVISSWSEIEAWMGEQTIISGIPNFIFPVAAGVLLFMFMGRKR
jgi:hypothetical protein